MCGRAEDRSTLPAGVPAGNYRKKPEITRNNRKKPEKTKNIMEMKATIQREAPATERAEQVEHVSPEVNIFETKDGYVLEAEMPGVDKSGLEITLEGTELTLAGRRRAERPPGEPLFRECATADFRRVFDLDPAIDTNRISARMEEGILTLTLPKSERVKPRKIAVE
jgi:HSP20 family protein